ncbi:hypothetical protein JMJ77_0000583 [Colletotrichum scovillei]|uniref:Uncharacterized protein n=1 Tax=Colletotrichum scovillei TaxID=1209932 RepID=A0A9P7RAK7_9PEZI|nr:hypothetical protein JMJ77_0000583 [Colletotrichum scovillei]KAG7071791.1 hypothetical protein JMJ76_0004659 [Colletotrichum scovillei]KAG7080037.1 hypothetical protein JMJ78_0007139 [Colletotrichum scovillei]
MCQGSSSPDFLVNISPSRTEITAPPSTSGGGGVPTLSYAGPIIDVLSALGNRQSGPNNIRSSRAGSDSTSSQPHKPSARPRDERPSGYGMAQS